MPVRALVDNGGLILSGLQAWKGKAFALAGSGLSI